MKLNEKIKKVRKTKNINQAVVANRLGITVQSYSMKETGKRPITINELEIISEIFDIPVANFFDENLNVKLNLDIGTSA